MNTTTIKRENFINLYNERGERHGYWERYYDNGLVMYKGNYVNGKEHGSWESYYKNGKLFSKGNYVNGNKHGSWEEYFDNGQLRYKGNYVDGNRHGLWEEYYFNGELPLKDYYDMGKQVDYDPNAQVELTLEEIAAKLNIPVERLKIKK